jgi:hypothetical protein
MEDLGEEGSDPCRVEAIASREDKSIVNDSKARCIEIDFLQTTGYSMLT